MALALLKGKASSLPRPVLFVPKGFRTKIFQNGWARPETRRRRGVLDAALFARVKGAAFRCPRRVDKVLEADFEEAALEIATLRSEERQRRPSPQTPRWERLLSCQRRPRGWEVGTCESVSVRVEDKLQLFSDAFRSAQTQLAAVFGESASALAAPSDLPKSSSLRKEDSDASQALSVRQRRDRIARRIGKERFERLPPELQFRYSSLLPPLEGVLRQPEEGSLKGQTAEASSPLEASTRASSEAVTAFSTRVHSAAASPSERRSPEPRKGPPQQHSLLGKRRRFR